VLFHALPSLPAPERPAALVLPPAPAPAPAVKLGSEGSPPDSPAADPDAPERAASESESAAPLAPCPGPGPEHERVVQELSLRHLLAERQYERALRKHTELEQARCLRRLPALPRLNL
jgi:hypothetical protein